MKNTLKIAVLALAATMLVACGSDFKKTDSGLQYKFITENSDGVQIQDGDLIVGTIIMSFNDSVIDSMMTPNPLFLVGNQSRFKGDFDEGFKMMHVGDEAIFAIQADSMVALGAQFPPEWGYKAGEGHTLRFHVKVTDVKNEAKEAEEITNYVKTNNITVEPTEEGIYIVSVAQGNGAKVENGKKVKINYTGRFLDGKVFDTSDTTVAPEAHEALEYTVGEQAMIPGWDIVVSTLCQGDKVTAVIPSKMAYGMGNQYMPPFSTLVFDMEVLSVK